MGRLQDSGRAFRAPLGVALVGVALLALAGPASRATAAAAVDLAEYQPDCGVRVRHEPGRLELAWPLDSGELGQLVLDLRGEGPLIERLAIASANASEAATVLAGVDPVTFVTVGTRVGTPGRPPRMSPFNEFFDAPAKRPHQSYRSRLERRQARVVSRGRRASVVLGDLAIGPFAGELHLTVYPGARLVHVEAVVATFEEGRAFVYDAGLAAAAPTWRRFAWTDPEGVSRSETVDATAADRPLKARHRAIAVETAGGALACIPPPHQFFFPRDLTDNLGTVWQGRGHRGLDDRAGFGVRQPETGGGAFVPWSSAPPGTRQRLGVFYVLSRGKAEDALREAARYTRGDRFPALTGHLALTSHWHMAIAVAALRERERGGERTTPDFVAMFKEMGVNIVHLAEFHGDGHPQDPGPLRLPELEAMFAECRRLSDDRLLLLPGEEANVHIGRDRDGKHPGHWLYLFPKPVYWTMNRASGQPFSEDVPKLGTVYHVGNAEEMTHLLERAHGLAWTAHPRIKASSWSPDAYRNDDFYKSGSWLGAAWKAMPADLSRPRMGERALDLLDDMANWGGRKYLLGEVDVFKLDRTHELYGHMNVNYVRLDRLPRFDDDWTPILDAVRNGRFWVTTGEVLLRGFTVGGKASGETLAPAGREAIEVRLEIEWTFPLRCIELISGDGTRLYRERLDQADTGPFAARSLTLTPDLKGRTWVRVEAWDVAGNGAFTQPVWLAPEAKTGGEPAR